MLGSLCFINHNTKEVFDFVIGARTKLNIGILIEKLLKTNPKQIRTDKLNIYKSLIPSILHKTVKRCTNHIERHNLTLRTHLKRLSRRSISYSRSKEMLYACLNLYFQ